MKKTAKKITQFNTPLVKQAVLAKQANQRQTNSNTKTRGEVSGGGKKPWKQKGTGRARAGSSRSPIWSGGGVTFGPRKEQNFKQKLPKKMNRQALAQLLQYLHSLDRVISVPSLAITEAKTKQVANLLKTHNLGRQATLLVTENLEPELVLAAGNLAQVMVRQNINLSVLDLANMPMVIMEATAYEARLPKAKPAVEKADKVVKTKVAS